MKKPKYHKTVLTKEVLNALHINNQAKYIDATLGTGGHSQEIIRNGGLVLGIEADEDALKTAKRRLDKACSAVKHKAQSSCFKLVHANFKDIGHIAKISGYEKVNGILFDLGVNSQQLTSDKRGFSFSNPKALLDMRIDPQGQKVTAADLLNGLRQDQLDEMFLVVLDYKEAINFTKRVVETRKTSPFRTVGDLLKVAGRSNNQRSGLHPATKAFLALRIAVNSELENIKEAIPAALSLLASRGRLVVISFHSGEDKVIKECFRDFQKNDLAEIETKKPIIPTKQEIKANPSARSAKMRILIKI